MLSLPANPTVADMAAAYASRDGELYRNETSKQLGQRMYACVGKLGWHAESDATWHRRLQRQASLILMQSRPNTTVEEIWEEARRKVPRRPRNARVEAVMAAVEEGLSLERIYSNFFTLHELTFLGW